MPIDSLDTHAESPVPTGIALTALDERFRADPYPVLADLRQREPVHYDAQLRRYVFTRYADVTAILGDPALWTDPRKGNPGTFTREFLSDGDEEPSMLLMDDPDHRRLRSLVRHAFTPRAVERWRSRVREVAERVIDEVADGEFDLIERVAGPIPTVVIAELLGIDPASHARFKAWSDASVKVAFGPTPDKKSLEAATQARDALEALFRGEIEARRTHPGDDLISDMMGAEVEGNRLTDREIVMLCNLLLVAGNVTTTDLIGNGVKALLDHPEELAKLRARPELVGNAVEEMLRYDSPVTNSGRIANRHIEIDGVEIGRGESLMVSLAAANRDPAAYPDPDRFDIERADTHHHAFGGGRHFCLGSHLARLEAQTTIAALLERFPTIAHAGDGFAYAAIPAFRGLERFCVKVSSH